MKKIIYVLTIALLLGACDNGFEDLNVDPTKANQVGISSKLTAAQLLLSSERYDNWRGNLIYCSTMMQHIATTANYWNGNFYTWNRGYCGALMERAYPNVIKQLEDMLLQVEQESQPAEVEAIVRILRVVAFHRLTDLYGDIPYSEAGKAVIEGNLNPKYDAQADIYSDMLAELEAAASALSAGGTSSFGSADIMFNGNLDKWRKYANSMMLRLGLRMIKVNPAAAQEWATKAINGGVMESNADIAFVPHTAGPEGINQNGNGEVFLADGNPRLSSTFVGFLQGDPRLPILGARRSDGSTNPADLIGLAPGLDAALLLDATGEDNTDAYAEPNRNIITGLDAPMFMQTYAEVEFMLAEAGVRWNIGGDPATNYAEGVRAAMKMLEMYGEAAIIDDADIDAYLAANPYDAANAIEQINTQYWIATFLNDYETYANWRRVGFPVLTPVSYPGNVTNGQIPRRLSYLQNEESRNPVNLAEAISRQGPDELSTRVWWDVE